MADMNWQSMSLDNTGMECFYISTASGGVPIGNGIGRSNIKKVTSKGYTHTLGQMRNIKLELNFPQHNTTKLGLKATCFRQL